MGLTSWTQPLQVATEIRPDIPRELGDQTFRSFTPMRPPDAGPLLPSEAVIWLDGRRIEREPTLLGGPHIVQQERDGVWTTQLLRDRGFPDEWKAHEDLPSPVVDVAPTASRGVGLLWILGGGGAAGQTISAPASTVPSTQNGGAVVGVASDGGVSPLPFSWALRRRLPRTVA